jgi:beta-lactam-binding protein with PASTA domain
VKTRNILWLLPFVSFLGGYLFLQSQYKMQELDTPLLVGKQLREALVILAQHNISPHLLDEKEDPDLPEGTIVSQTPQANTKIKSNQSIYFIISRKPSKRPAPTCINTSLEQAKQELETKNLRYKYYYLPSNHPKDWCFAQNPGPGQLLEDSTVILYISDGNPKPVIMPNFKGKSLESIQDLLQRYPVSIEIVHHPRQLPGHQCITCIVSDQRPLAGSLITFDTQKTLPITLQVQPS